MWCCRVVASCSPQGGLSHVGAGGGWGEPAAFGVRDVLPWHCTPQNPSHGMGARGWAHPMSKCSQMPGELCLLHCSVGTFGCPRGEAEAAGRAVVVGCSVCSESPHLPLPFGVSPCPPLARPASPAVPAPIGAQGPLQRRCSASRGAVLAPAPEGAAWHRCCRLAPAPGTACSAALTPPGSAPRPAPRVPALLGGAGVPRPRSGPGSAASP